MKTSLHSTYALAAGLGLAFLAPSAATPGGKFDKNDGKPVELATTGWTTLMGTVTYEGKPPPPRTLDFRFNKDARLCHDGAQASELIEQTWLVNPKNRGVANVVIWVSPPRGAFFKIHESYLRKKENVIELRQPHCAFIPHTLVYWASYYDKDTGEQKPSGQKLRIRNDAKFVHNTGWAGDEDINPRGTLTLVPGDSKLLTFRGQDTPISFKCDIHPWMHAKCWSLDTPYCARTDENGKFTIPNVPAGDRVRIVAWHEGVGFVFGQEGKTMLLNKDREVQLSFSIKAR
jgi:hypothetical protein